MALKNTVEVVGDAALTRSIIDRSITELNCNITTSIRDAAFRGCSALANVNFPSVTSVAENAFYGCAALTKADFASVVAFASGAFQNCSALTALILRNTYQISTITGTPFASSAIASGTGYIYVPAALVDQYKASWTTYAAQFRAIEDYPGVVDPYSWSGVAANIADGSYKSVYNIGDTVPLDLGASGVYSMKIAAFDVDEKADGTGKAAISWISEEVFALDGSISLGHFNPAVVTNDDGTYKEGTGTIGGWGSSELRKAINNIILPLIPGDVINVICEIKNEQTAFDTSGNSFTQVTNDVLWTVGYPNSQYTTTKKKKRLVGTGTYGWWTREAYSRNTCYAYMYSGSIKDIACNATSGSTYTASTVPICFCT